jgi:hypothetical protein
MIAYDAAKPLVSLHVPKCAGQALRRILEQWFGNRFFIHYFQQYNALPPKHPLQPGICIHGHFDRTREFGVMHYYPEVDQFIAVLRDPLEAALSNYFFWKAKARSRQLHMGMITAGGEHDYKNIDDFFCKRPRSNMLHYMPGEMTRENFREIIGKKFVWIGFVESIPESMAGLARRLGFAPLPLPRVNASARDEELSPALRQAFLSANDLEFEIVHYAKETMSANGILDAR